LLLISSQLFQIKAAEGVVDVVSNMEWTDMLIATEADMLHPTVARTVSLYTRKLYTLYTLYTTDARVSLYTVE